MEPLQQSAGQVVEILKCDCKYPSEAGSLGAATRVVELKRITGKLLLDTMGGVSPRKQIADLRWP